MKKKAARKTTRKKAPPASKGQTPPEEQTSASSEAAPQASAFPIVGIGASAGGLEALKELFSHLPESTGMAFVVVTHQLPGRVSLLPELLDEATPLPVTEAANGVLVQPDHVYVAPPGGLLTILNRTLQRLEIRGTEPKRLPIDSFLTTLAHDRREHAACVILSGTGTDGTLGLRAIKGENGMAMVQDPKSALHSGMPLSAAGTGLADFVLSPAAMAAQLLAYTGGPFLRADEGTTITLEPLQQVLLLLFHHTGHDFSGYKTTTMRRRIERRMNLHAIENPGDYLDFLKDNPREIDLLFKELLISVTSFFRDPEAFESLAAGPLADLLHSRPEGQGLRVWVPGCATGEETYSIAILLQETMSRLDRQFEVQIFGTDLDAEVIEVARAAHYPEGISGDVSPQRLERYFVPDEGSWRISKGIREMCIFAPHNVVKDPSFTRLDLVSCRNLLIYLGSELQQRLLQVFHYALKPKGLLFLGPSESIGASDCFEPACSKWKIYRRREVAGAIQGVPSFPLGPPRAGKTGMGTDAFSLSQGTAVTPATPTVTLPPAERLLLDWFCPPCVVVNERGDIIHIQGRTGAYLEPASGKPRMNVLEMAREGLQLVLSHALHKAAGEKGDAVTREGVRVKANGPMELVNVTVTRIQSPEALRGLYVISFTPTPTPSKTSAKSVPSSGDPNQIEELERELQYTKESLHSTIEQAETSNEELKSTNEELQSTNEELQSSNEELETSKEEMQSLNEELTTVNAELSSKVEALAQNNDDMQNLLNSTHIATIFLDNQLNIKRFTDRARKIIKLIPTDVGRPIGDLVSNLDYDNLEEDCRQVFKTLNTTEIEVQTGDGAWYQMCIMPYRTSNNLINGLVITFVDINEIRRAAREAHAYFEGIVQTVRHPLLVLGDDLHVRACNRAFCDLANSNAQSLHGIPFFEIGSGAWNQPALKEALLEILPKNTSIEGLEVSVDLPGKGRHHFLLNARRMVAGFDEPGILLAFELSKA